MLCEAYVGHTATGLFEGSAQLSYDWRHSSNFLNILTVADCVTTWDVRSGMRASVRSLRVGIQVPSIGGVSKQDVADRERKADKTYIPRQTLHRMSLLLVCVFALR